MNGAPFPFESEPEARQVWRAHSAALMADSRPGSRPCGFWRYELRMFRTVPSFWRGLGILIDRGLIDATEAARLEHDLRELSPDPGTYCQSYDSAALIAENTSSHVDHDPRLLMESIEHFETAARWHAWRGRPEAAERWARRVEVVRMCIVASD